MKPRTVVLTFEIVTDLPVKALRRACVATSINECDGRFTHYLQPVNKPRVEVIQPVKRKAKAK